MDRVGSSPFPRDRPSSLLAAGDVGKGRNAKLGADLAILLGVSRDFICA